MSRLSGSIAILLACAGAAVASPPPIWMHHDDGTPYQPVFRQNEKDGWGVKITPALPGFIQRVKIYVGNPPGNSSWDGFNLEIWSWNDMVFPEMPGTRKWGPKYFSYDYGGWVTYKNVDYHWDGNKSFVVALKQREGYPNCDTVYCDPAQTVPNPNWSYFNSRWTPFSVVNGDLLIWVYYGESYPGVEAASFGRVRALYR
jgi:hypothetical protein